MSFGEQIENTTFDMSAYLREIEREVSRDLSLRIREANNAANENLSEILLNLQASQNTETRFITLGRDYGFYGIYFPANRTPFTLSPAAEAHMIMRSLAEEDDEIPELNRIN